MASLVADYGTSSGSESENDAPSDDTDNSKGDEEEDDDDDDGGGEKEERVGGGDDNEAEADVEKAADFASSDSLPEDDDSGRRRGIVDRTNGRVKSDRSSKSAKKLPLPTPDFTAAPTLKTSVFSNPFVEAEKAKSAILEKHVKMTPTLDDTKMINGRKICWNYRKGRCRFGHNCTFAHDSDLHRSAAELEALRTPEETIICQTHYSSQTTTTTTGPNEEEQEIDQENNQLQKRKKRPGLAQNLVPGKKVLKLYKAQQAKAVSR